MEYLVLTLPNWLIPAVNKGKAKPSALPVVYRVARFSNGGSLMHNAIPLILAALMALGIIVIGCFYLLSPEPISGTFGLKPPPSDADTRACLRPTGFRAIRPRLIVLPMWLTADRPFA